MSFSCNKCSVETDGQINYNGQIFCDRCIRKAFSESKPKKATKTPTSAPKIAKPASKKAKKPAKPTKESDSESDNDAEMCFCFFCNQIQKNGADLVELDDTLSCCMKCWKATSPDHKFLNVSKLYHKKGQFVCQTCDYACDTLSKHNKKIVVVEEIGHCNECLATVLDSQN